MKTVVTPVRAFGFYRADCLSYHDLNEMGGTRSDRRKAVLLYGPFVSGQTQLEAITSTAQGGGPTR